MNPGKKNSIKLNDFIFLFLKNKKHFRFIKIPKNKGPRKQQLIRSLSNSK